MTTNSVKVLVASLAIIGIGLQYRLWVGDGSIAQVVRLNKQIDAQEAENNGLKERNRYLSAEVDALKNGTDGIEERARHQMGMIKEGETFFLIVDKNKK